MYAVHYTDIFYFKAPFFYVFVSFWEIGLGLLRHALVTFSVPSVHPLHSSLLHHQSYFVLKGLHISLLHGRFIMQHFLNFSAENLIIFCLISVHPPACKLFFLYKEPIINKTHCKAFLSKMGTGNSVLGSSEWNINHACI